MLEKYGHGGDVLTAAELYGGESGAFLDFSANINPLGPPPAVLEMLQNALPAVIAYPDPGHRRLKALLSENLGTDSSWLTVANGAAESMALLLLAIAPRTVGIVEPCFSEYRQLSEQFGAQVLSVQGTREWSFRAGVEEISGLLEKVELLFLGQPNNPNGVQYSLDELRVLAQKAESYGTYLAVDEAFIDFIPQVQRNSLLPELLHYRHTVLVRSMTKFYAIPGLRLGFTIAHPELAAAMTGKQVTWSVNGLALLAGEACLRSGEDYEQRTRELIITERALLRQGLQQLGCDVPPGEANFLLCGLPAPWRAAELQTRLGRSGILVRNCAMYPGLGPEHIRVAVKGREDCTSLLRQMGKILAAGPEVVSSARGRY
ncbi:pyridoxal phosphate-dependent aminotransferase [Paenibacillus monticola]|uniref:Aminotransferase n=1 Tax=Paenibacillus monticola TaxID=2666075 RepID=A0A7X2H1J7_9BACL|nr:threonine-phosphate decarboxylase [Paenibacillus monticola]MRN51845.1 aminotransferase class I/II-fold pyridoxal phosphate-dependent enzyme [Paenibacillus monticola]